MWDVSRDEFRSMEDVTIFKFANLFLDESKLEPVFFSEYVKQSIEIESDELDKFL